MKHGTAHKICARRTKTRFLLFYLCSLFATLLLLESIRDVSAFETISTVKNLRPIVPASIYRAASLDSLSLEDARSLLDGCEGRPLAAIIDLRNLDEIEKGKGKHSEGSTFFYSSLAGSGSSDGDYDEHYYTRFLHIPLLGNVDAFWDETIGRMDTASRLAATLQTAFQGGALDRAAARQLEKGGLPMLYTIMMTTAPLRIASVLQACATESARGPVIFHCQKGKDRTGVIAMLLQRCLGASDEEILEAYGASGDLLGGEESSSAAESSSEDPDCASKSNSGMIDWSHFRGSPSSAMADTLEWIRERHGSVENYLEFASFDKEQQKNLKQTLLQIGDQQPL
jgi:hypothetical protein